MAGMPAWWVSLGPDWLRGSTVSALMAVMVVTVVLVSLQ